MKTTLILHCATCQAHTFQDETYGKNMRVHNQSGTSPEARCTVCGRTQAISEAQWTAKTKKAGK